MSNYPDTTYEADPRAPWNAKAPWRGETCGTCAYMTSCVMMDDSTICVCRWDDGVAYEVASDKAACPAWMRSLPTTRGTML